MEFSVVSKININKEKCEKIGAFLYDRDQDALYHDSPWPFPVQIGISMGLSRCEVTPGFLKLPFILKGWINHDILLREIDLLKLALQDKILMHASCVDGILVVGFPNAGKTYKTFSMLANGGTLISEEYTIIDMNRAHPYKPKMRTCFSASTIKDCRIPVSFGDRVALFFNTLRAKLMPFMFEAVIWKMVPVSGKTAEIKKIVYGSSEIEVKDWKTFAILCENEFPFMSSEFLQAYALASGLDLIAIQTRQRELIRRFVKHVYPDHRK